MSDELTASELRVLVAPFRDEWGFITPVKYPPGNGHYPGGGNVLLYTGLYYTILAMKGALTQADADSWVRSLMLCRHERFPLFWRSPVKKNADDNQEHDDYWAILAACKHAGCEYIARGILEHGRRHSWSYDIQKPETFNIKFYFARFMAFIPMARVCSGEEISLLEQARLYLAILFGGGSSSSWMRCFLMASVIRDRGPIGRWLYNRTVRRMSFVGEIPDSHPLADNLFSRI